MATRVTIIGQRQMRRRFAELEDQIDRGAKRAVEEAAEQVRTEVRSTVRVDTTALKRGVGVFLSRSGLRADVGWRDRKLYYAKFLEFGTNRVRADPVLTRAGEAERRRLPGRVTREVRQEIGP